MFNCSHWHQYSWASLATEARILYRALEKQHNPELLLFPITLEDREKFLTMSKILFTVNPKNANTKQSRENLWDPKTSKLLKHELFGFMREHFTAKEMTLAEKGCIEANSGVLPTELDKVLNFFYKLESEARNKLFYRGGCFG